MSLVGPRPERPEFVEVLAEQLPGYLNRLMVQPGITGLAQINLPPDTDLDSVRRKLILDCDYIRSAGWWLDLRIVLCTALRMFWIKGPAISRLLGLERLVHLPADNADRATAEEEGHAAPVSVASLSDTAARCVARLDVAPAALAHIERPAMHAAGSATARVIASAESSG
jgi:Bacterial sugar transferase